MRKFHALAVLAVMAVCCLTVMSTVAFFTTESTATNVITVGKIDIRLIEEAIDKEGKTIPYADPERVLPGEEVSKIVTLENTGDHDAFVCISLIKTVTNNGNTLDADVIRYTADDEHWLYRDGYYYYYRALRPGERTEPLIQSVTIDASASTEYEFAKAQLVVQGFAVQSDNNGTDPLSAAGWPQ